MSVRQAKAVLIVEDHALVREFLAKECAQILPGFAVHAAGTAAAALESCRQHPPSLVILDLVLPDGDGLDLASPIAKLSPEVKIVALSSHIDEVTVHRAARCSIQALLDKNEQPIAVLRLAIDAVLAGRSYLSPAAQRLKAHSRADPLAFAKLLSEREQEALRLIGEGLDNPAVAARLGIEPGTAKRHRLKIMAKLGIHSTPGLIRYALEKGFTRVPDAAGARPGAPTSD
jgi:DNA-binding NarL/FixJ family response regulator